MIFHIASNNDNAGASGPLLYLMSGDQCTWPYVPPLRVNYFEGGSMRHFGRMVTVMRVVIFKLIASDQSNLN